METDTSVDIVVNPGDNCRFYSDTGQALSYWSGKRISNEPIYPVKFVETFNVFGD